MIAVINARKDLYATLEYNNNKVSEGTARVLCTENMLNVMGKYILDQEIVPSDYYKAIKAYTDRSLRTEKTVTHISLNPSPHDVLDDEQYIAIARDYMAQMGYEQQPYIVYLHEDIERKHIHIVSSRVDKQGVKINSYMDRVRSTKITRWLEKKYNLTPAVDESTKLTYKERAEQRKESALRTLADTQVATTLLLSERYVKSKLRKAALIASAYHIDTFDQYRLVLKQFNIGFEVKEGKRNGVPYTGIVYFTVDENGQRNGRALKGSTLAEEVTVPALTKCFEANRKKKTSKTTAFAKESLRKRIDFTLKQYKQLAGYTFVEEMAKQGITVLLNYSALGRITGATFIDHTTQSVFKGSELGKAYSANALEELLIRSANGVEEEIVPLAVELFALYGQLQIDGSLIRTPEQMDRLCADLRPLFVEYLRKNHPDLPLFSIEVATDSALKVKVEEIRQTPKQSSGFFTRKEPEARWRRNIEQAMASLKGERSPADPAQLLKNVSGIVQHKLEINPVLITLPVVQELLWQIDQQTKGNLSPEGFDRRIASIIAKECAKNPIIHSFPIIDEIRAVLDQYQNRPLHPIGIQPERRGFFASLMERMEQFSFFGQNRLSEICNAETLVNVVECSLREREQVGRRIIEQIESSHVSILKKEYFALLGDIKNEYAAIRKEQRDRYYYESQAIDNFSSIKPPLMERMVQKNPDWPSAKIEFVIDSYHEYKRSLLNSIREKETGYFAQNARPLFEYALKCEPEKRKALLEQFDIKIGVESGDKSRQIVLYSRHNAEVYCRMNMPFTHAAFPATSESVRTLYKTDKELIKAVATDRLDEYLQANPIKRGVEWMPAFDYLSEADRKRVEIRMNRDRVQSFLAQQQGKSLFGILSEGFRQGIIFEPGESGEFTIRAVPGVCRFTVDERCNRMLKECGYRATFNQQIAPLIYKERSDSEINLRYKTFVSMYEMYQKEDWRGVDRQIDFVGKINSILAENLRQAQKRNNPTELFDTLLESKRNLRPKIR